MKTLKFILLSIVLTIAFTSCSPDSNSINEDNYPVDLTLSSQTNWQLADQVLEVVNQHRVSIGLQPLAKDAQYASAYAVEHTQYMMEKQEISHDNFHYRSQALQSHGAQKVAEVVAYGFTDAESVVRAWLNSPPHRRALEGDYSKAGFGVIQCHNGTYYFTQLLYK